MVALLPGLAVGLHKQRRVVGSTDRDGLQAQLRDQGVATAIHYPRPLHLQPALGDARGKEGDLPVSEALCREALSLPLYPELPLESIARIATTVRTFCLQTAQP